MALQILTAFQKNSLRILVLLCREVACSCTGAISDEHIGILSVKSSFVLCGLTPVFKVQSRWKLYPAGKGVSNAL